MNCAEARRLLDRGIRPGSATAGRALLGFHVAGCPACRAYQVFLERDLLADLLSQIDDRPAAAPDQPEPDRPLLRRLRREPLGRLLWYASLGTLAAFVLVVASILAWAALSIFTIHQNVQAMIVPTSTATDRPLSPLGGFVTQQPYSLRGAPALQAPFAATLQAASTTPLPPTATSVPTDTRHPTLVPATPTPQPPQAGGPVTVLLLGSDQRPGENDPARTDAIIIARIDPQRHRVALLSLPRDLWVEIPGYGSARINAANVWGIIYNDPEGGLGLARKTVSNLFGIPIDYTVLINFEGFIGAIDALGGIDVEVTKELYDAQFPTMDYGYTVAHFLPGRQHMDGATALMYSRIRHPDSDFERLRRQQAVLVGVLGRLREQDVLQSLKSLEDMTAALRGYVQTDMPEERMIGLGWALRDFTPDHVEHYLLDENMIAFGIGADRYAEVARPGAIEALVRQLLGQ